MNNAVFHKHLYYRAAVLLSQRDNTDQAIRAENLGQALAMRI